MTYFILTLLLSTIAIALAYKSKRDYSVVIPVTVLSLIIFLYILALVNVLSLGLIIFLIIGVGSAIYLAFIIIRKETTLNRLLINPGLIAFALAVFLNYFWNANRLLVHWDEFSHWGLVVKNMHLFDALGTVPGATTYFVEYPPGASLLLYLYTSFSIIFKEPVLYMAFNIMQVSLLLPFLSLYKRSNWKEAILPALLILFLPLAFYSNAYSSLYVDCLLGLAFAYLFFIHYHHKDRSTFKIFSLCLAAAFLVLIKPIGLFFALLGIGIIILDSLLTDDCNFGAKLIYFIPLVAIFLAHTTWNLHLANSASEFVWNAEGLSLNALLTLLTAPAEYAFVTIRSFGREIIPYLHLGLFFLGLSIFAYHIMLVSKSVKKKRLIILTVGIIGGFVLYALVLLLLYLTVFSEQEAVNLASFNRYMNTFALGSSLLALYLLLSLAMDIKKYKTIILLYLMFHLSFFVFPAIYAGYMQIDYAKTLRSELDKTLIFKDFMNAEDDRIYFISQGSTGRDYWIARYNVTPLQLNRPFSWSIVTEQGYESDPYIRVITVSEWEEQLRNNYTYVYLHSIDDSFKKDYGNFFIDYSSIGNRTLYQVTTEKEGLVLIEAN